MPPTHEIRTLNTCAAIATSSQTADQGEEVRVSSVSVVMAVYNGQTFLQAQMDSMLRDLCQEDELIIINDASVDGSSALLTGIKWPTMQVHTNASNIGVMASFEKGIRLATNEFIFLSDQDDIWLMGKRAAFLEAFAKDSSVSAVISDAQLIDAEGRVFAPSLMATRYGFDGSVLATLWRNRYTGCVMALRRSLLEAALPIPQRVPMHDMWFGAIASLTGKVAYLPTPYLQHRRHRRNVTPSRPQSLGRMLTWRINLLVGLVARMVSISLGLHRAGIKDRKTG